MKQSDVKLQWGLEIPLRDGTALFAALYLPVDRNRPSAAIVLATPYGAQMYHDQGVYFSARGWPFLAVDVRGRGNSGGEFHPRNEAADAHDVVEWLAQQPYCNGQVAMCGGSYSGYVQWAVTKNRPVHLATIVPVASPYRGVDTPLRSNVFAPYTVRWLTMISGLTTQDRIAIEDRTFWSAQFRRWRQSGTPFRALDSFVGNPSKLFQEWVSHPQQDEYWDSYNPSAEDYAKLTVPVLTITGAYDANQLGALAHYRQHMKHATDEARVKHYLVIGPWDHAGTRTPKLQFGGLSVGHGSLIDLRELHLQWYEWTMQGAARPQFLQKNVAYYVTRADKWRYADTLDSVTSHSRSLYLHSNCNPTDVFNSGSLIADCRPSCKPACYVYDPRDCSSAELESAIDPDDLTDQRLIHAVPGKQLIYHSEPFASGLEISGFFRLSVCISIDQPDTDFRAAVYEVALDGSSVLLATDMMRARYRESLRRAQLIRTQEPLRYDFERFTFVSRYIAAGSRLRLVIGPINSIYGQKNYNSGGVVADETMEDARVVTVRVFQGGTYPSALHVPIGRPAD